MWPQGRSGANECQDAGHSRSGRISQDLGRFDSNHASCARRIDVTGLPQDLGFNKLRGGAPEPVKADALDNQVAACKTLESCFWQ